MMSFQHHFDFPTALVGGQGCLSAFLCYTLASLPIQRKNPILYGEMPCSHSRRFYGHSTAGNMAAGEELPMV